MLMDIHDIQNVTKVAEKLLALFSEPFRIMNHEMFVSASIGIALYPNDGSTSEQLLKNADTAMYQVKSHGKNAYQFFTPEMNIKIQDRLHKETKLRRALERQEFVLHYQPRIGLPTGQIIGMEALIRWQPEGQHLIYPLDFIPILEESGMIVSVGEWVLRTACQQNKRWQEQGLGELMIAINISARQFFQQNLIEKIEQILKETDMSPSYLIIELTESIIMHDVEAAIVQLQKLKEMGIHLAIDDFGTGYSSLNYLKRFPVDELKIDKSFINGLLIEKNDASIVMAIIALAHSLEMKVVAEGVEDGNQLNFLMAQKCEEIQGYYFSRPLDRVAFEELVRSGNIRKIQ
jgi:EAL domain-containing protein (putative c-di-GMP-specific phosphodiesterase class I)